MKIAANYSLKNLNTFHVDAKADRYAPLVDEDQIITFLDRYSLTNDRYLILGGGSNLLFVNDFKGIVLHPVLKGIEAINVGQNHVLVRAMAGEDWDDLVAFAIARRWGGIENLSLIPGSVGSSAVQNIGAYGVEVQSVIKTVEAISISDGEKVTFLPQDCGFGYRASHFKGQWKNRFIVTAVVFKLLRKPHYTLDYPGVKTSVEKQGALNLENLRRAIIALRRSKLPDPDMLGNAGSFFKNPVVSGSTLNNLLDEYADMPYYPQGCDRYKLAAGWLIEKCGWKGKRVGRAAVHEKQALVLVNCGEASGREIFDLAEQIKASVAAKFLIALEREVEVVR